MILFHWASAHLDAIEIGQHSAPTKPECSRLLEAKHDGNSRLSFRNTGGSVSKGTASLQHRQTSIRSGLANTEFISDNVATSKEQQSTARLSIRGDTHFGRELVLGSVLPPLPAYDDAEKPNPKHAHSLPADRHALRKT